MTTVSNDIDQTNGRIGNTINKRFAPSGSILEDLLEFMMDVAPDALPETEIDNLGQLFGDLEYLDNRQMNEARHFTRKSTTIARSRARKWYQKNKGRVKKLQARLKTKAAKKKKEIMSKSDRTPIKKRKKRKYPGTKNHINAAIDRKIERGARNIVEKMLEPHRYRVIRRFTINENIDASLNELIEHYGNETWVLEKRNGKRYRFEVNNGVLAPYIKLEYLIETEDFI